MKKIYSLLIMLLAVVGTIAAENVKVGDFYYQLNDTEAILWTGNPNPNLPSPYADMETIEVPATVTYAGKTYPVTKIGIRAFTQVNSTSITLPEGLVLIGSEVFLSCPNLTQLNIPASLETITGVLFHNCPKLQNVQVAPSNTRFEMRRGCLIDKVEKRLVCAIHADNPVIPYGVEKIEKYAFDNDIAATKIAVPYGVKTISSWAFGCPKTEVSLPPTLETMGDGAFYNCADLNKVICNAATPPVITSSSFHNLNPDATLYVPRFSGEAYRAADVWKDFANIEEVDYGLSQNFINYNDGELSYRLRGDSAEVWTGNPDPNQKSPYTMETVNVPAIVTYDGQEFPVRSIYMRTFGQTPIKSITLPEGLVTLGDGVFWYCPDLTSINIPASLQDINGSLFTHCPNLQQIDIADGCTNYEMRNNCLIETSTKALISVLYGQSATIPEGVEIVAARAFYDDESITKAIVPDGVTTIGSWQFAYCPVTEISLPATIETIASGAFYNCTGATKVTCEATTPPEISGQTFKNVTAVATLYVPAASIDAYRAADIWKDFKYIQPIIATGITAPAISATQRDAKVLRDGRIVVSRNGVQYGVSGVKE